MKKTILVVDDESDSREMLRTYFELGGFNVHEARDGYEAVAKALEFLPDLVIMDMAMPMVDGVNCARTMRLHEELLNTPIIALSGYGPFYEPRALDAGCTDFLCKPVDLALLEPLVTRHLGY